MGNAFNGWCGICDTPGIHLSSEVAEARTPPDSWLSEIAGILVVSATIELPTWWLRQKQPEPMERIAEIHERITISPVMNAKKHNKR